MRVMETLELEDAGHPYGWQLRLVMLMGKWLARGYLIRARWSWWVSEGWRAEKSASRRWCRERRRVRAQLTDIYGQGMARGLGWSAGAPRTESLMTGESEETSVWLQLVSLSGRWYGRLLIAAYG
jgi:hypothetical protein